MEEFVAHKPLKKRKGKTGESLQLMSEAWVNQLFKNRLAYCSETVEKAMKKEMKRKAERQQHKQEEVNSWMRENLFVDDVWTIPATEYCATFGGRVTKVHNFTVSYVNQNMKTAGSKLVYILMRFH